MTAIAAVRSKPRKEEKSIFNVGKLIKGECVMCGLEFSMMRKAEGS